MPFNHKRLRYNLFDIRAVFPSALHPKLYLLGHPKEDDLLAVFGRPEY